MKGDLLTGDSVTRRHARLVHSLGPGHGVESKPLNALRMGLAGDSIADDLGNFCHRALALDPFSKPTSQSRLKLPKALWYVHWKGRDVH